MSTCENTKGSPASEPRKETDSVSTEMMHQDEPTRNARELALAEAIKELGGEARVVECVRRGWRLSPIVLGTVRTPVEVLDESAARAFGARA